MQGNNVYIGNKFAYSQKLLLLPVSNKYFYSKLNVLFFPELSSGMRNVPLWLIQSVERDFR